MTVTLEQLIQDIERLPKERFFGRVTGVRGLLVECAGLANVVSIGARCSVAPRKGQPIPAEVVGIKGHTVLLMPFNDVEGVGVGCKVMAESDASLVYPCDAWKGRILNALGGPTDDKGALPSGVQGYGLKTSPPLPHQRMRVEGKIDLGVRVLNTFTTCCRGQRMGIFSGSGVGKSMLVSMLARYSNADVKVIGLIGERSREVKEFIEDYLGEEGMKQAVVVVATGNESALMRRQAAYLTMSIAEYFRDEGKNVLLMMDSLTRFAQAQREIGLSVGEPPTTKGYTPTVFTELPRLLERAGPGTQGKGTITGLFTVLVEGDDTNEPVSDTVRGILDGHIVLERAIAERGRFPAVNVIKSVSRTMPGCNSREENELVQQARSLLATYQDMAELIRLGAYKKGSDPKVDEAIRYHDALENFLKQASAERSDLASGYSQLATILSAKSPAKMIEKAEVVAAS